MYDWDKFHEADEKEYAVLQYQHTISKKGKPLGPNDKRIGFEGFKRTDSTFDYENEVIFTLPNETTRENIPENFRSVIKVRKPSQLF